MIAMSAIATYRLDSVRCRLHAVGIFHEDLTSLKMTHRLQRLKLVFDYRLAFERQDRM